MKKLIVLSSLLTTMIVSGCEQEEETLFKFDTNTVFGQVASSCVNNKELNYNCIANKLEPYTVRIENPKYKVYAKNVRGSLPSLDTTEYRFQFVDKDGKVRDVLMSDNMKVYDAENKPYLDYIMLPDTKQVFDATLHLPLSEYK